MEIFEPAASMNTETTPIKKRTNIPEKIVNSSKETKLGKPENSGLEKASETPSLPLSLDQNSLTQQVENIGNIDDSDLAMKSPIPSRSTSRRPSEDKRRNSAKPDDIAKAPKPEKRRRSKGNEGHNPTSKKVASQNDNETSQPSSLPAGSSDPKLVPSSTTSKKSTPATSNSNLFSNESKGKAEKISLHSSQGKRSLPDLDDEGSLASSTSVRSEIADGYPLERSQLVKLLKEKDQQILDKDKNMETELKKRVKDYIKSHGIGFGANQ